MVYKINDIEDINLEEIKNNSKIILESVDKLEGKADNLIFSTLVYDLVVNKSCNVLVKDIELEKDKYFDKAIVIKKDNELVKKIFRKGKRISEGTDNYLLPIGSLVKLSDESILYIVGRALQNEYIPGEQMYTDYVGYFYPKGMESEEKYIFNNEDILEILHVGYQDVVIDELSYGIKEVLGKGTYKKYKLTDEADEDITNI